MWIEDDGIRLSAVLEEPAGGAKGLIIVLHGFTSCKDRPHNVLAAEAMRDAGFATLRADLFGHGESGGTFRRHTLYKWIANTLTLIDWSRSSGFGPIYLSGHSQGGLVAALVAAMAPDRVSGLILRAPAFLIPEGTRKGSLLGFSFDPLKVPDVIPVAEGLDLDGNYLRVAQTVRVEEAIDAFAGPVLILQGNQDDSVPFTDSQQAAERYRNATLSLITGETHHFDRYPEKMRQIIRSWLETLPASPETT